MPNGLNKMFVIVLSLSQLVSDQTDIFFLKQLIQFYLNIATNLHSTSCCSTTWKSYHNRRRYSTLCIYSRGRGCSRPGSYPENNTWSSDSLTCVVRRAHNTYGDRCFATAGPRVWNSLQIELQQCDSLGRFKRCLKTFLFRSWNYGAL